MGTNISEEFTASIFSGTQLHCVIIRKTTIWMRNILVNAALCSWEMN
jgi:hypothetical protein